MQKIIFLGTDLHGDASEHAAKLVRDLKQFGDVVSIQNRKKREAGSRIIPKISENPFLRKLFQAIILPFVLLFLRANHNKIACFWVADSAYHYFLFLFLKIIRYKIYFTIISGYDKSYDNLGFCDVIICQSERMKRKIEERYPNKQIGIIYPWTDLAIFKPGKRRNYDLIVPSVPYKITDFEERGIDKILELTSKFKIKIIVRSQEAGDFLKEKAEVVNKIMSDAELSEVMRDAKAVALFYRKNAPDMPLSSIEALASGCAIVCLDNIGLSEIVIKNKCGIVISEMAEAENAIQKAISDKKTGERARKLAERLFNKQANIKAYEAILTEI
jgi:glycosyltransferase involved in cell wall biosynthesis